MKKCTHIQNYRILIKRKGIQLFRINHIAPCLPPSQKKKQKKKKKMCFIIVFDFSQDDRWKQWLYNFFFSTEGEGGGG